MIVFCAVNGSVKDIHARSFMIYAGSLLLKSEVKVTTMGWACGYDGKTRVGCRNLIKRLMAKMQETWDACIHLIGKSLAKMREARDACRNLTTELQAEMRKTKDACRSLMGSPWLRWGEIRDACRHFMRTPCLGSGNKGCVHKFD